MTPALKTRLLGLGLCLLVLAMVVASLNPVAINLDLRLLSPSLSHPLGTDPLGRDLVRRLLEGATVTLSLGLASVAVGGLIGGFVGIIAGYKGGWVDRVLMRLTDIQLTLPNLLLALLILATLGPSYLNLILILGLTGWTRFARVIRSEAQGLKTRDYVLAARSIGASHSRILRHHLLPNLAPSLLVLATLEMARVILLEAALSYLGLGIQPPTASWGRILAEGEVYIGSAWWLVSAPGLVILGTVLFVNRLGERLRRRLSASS